MGAEGSKQLLRQLINVWKIKRNANPAYIVYLMEKLFLVLEDTYSVGTMTELQEAIDAIGTGAGTIFIEAGEYEITIPINIDNCGSLVIYGHGDNTVLKPVDGITVFNITCCASLLVKTLKIDASNYTAPSVDVELVIIDEINDNIVSFSDVTITGLNNFGRGIDLRSENCIINHCIIGLLSYGILISADYQLITGNPLVANEIGLYCNGDYCTITENIVNSNTNLGIYLVGHYCNISNNSCIANSTGIFVNTVNNNTISNNTCSNNTFHGIRLILSNYNTISGNTCNDNDSNTAGNTAGIYIDANCDFNTISANSCNNNNNVGAGDGIGIYIAAATCNENVVAANNCNGNDIDFFDSGTATTITYYVQDSFELQDAIDSIGTKAGVINIDASFTVATTIDIDGNGSYIIQGEGSNSTLTTGDNQCFNITSARSVLLQNFKIDASAITGRNTVVINVNEAANNLVVIDNVEITGIVGRGWGVFAQSNYVQIKNCRISTIDMGIRISGDYCKAESNVCNGMDEYGIDCIGDYAIITNNTCNSCNDSGIQMNGGSYCNVSQNQCHSNNNYGIFVFSLDNMVLADNIFTLNATGVRVEDSNYVSINGNTSSDNITSGIVIAPTSSYNIVIGNTCKDNAAGYGIIVAAGCIENIVKSNNLSGNDVTWKDLGTNSDFEYRCSTAAEIQDAIDSIAVKSGVIKIVGTMSVPTTIDVDGGGDYTFEGEGRGTILNAVLNVPKCFSVTNARSTIFRNFTINLENFDTYDDFAIYIDEGSDNPVKVLGMVFMADTWDYPPTDLGTALGVQTANVHIIDCEIYNIYGGIMSKNLGGADNMIVSNNYFHELIDCITTNGEKNVIINGNRATNCLYGLYCIRQENCVISNNIFIGGFFSGIEINKSSHCVIIGNIVADNTIDTVAQKGLGILIETGGAEWAQDNVVSGNIIENNTNIGAADYYGIYINGGARVLDNLIVGNKLTGNDIDYLDLGTTTILFGDDTAYGVGWSGDLGTATKNALYDQIQLLLALAGGTMSGNIVMDTGAVITSADEDLTFIFGRAQIDSRFADMMLISHRDMSAQDNYAFGQLNDGKTYINAPTGKLIYFHINDVEKMSMSAVSLNMVIPIAMGTNKITGLGNGSAAQDAATFGQLGDIVATGTHTGNNVHQRTITVGFQPRFFFITWYNNDDFGFKTDNLGANNSMNRLGRVVNSMSFVATGVMLSPTSANLYWNTTPQVYTWVAFK